VVGDCTANTNSISIVLTGVFYVLTDQFNLESEGRSIPSELPKERVSVDVRSYG
jgi:hypothetical protein